ncbi:signal transduction histidine kinase [Bernardetia litoralis DSM 6794]|uniref:histidine kinase n=1 Tax=Bernardetia litoralis (strain ATCC 23117 / DSM 6794 / NBRC 15988 / NCIMB 1366 / Fx l1 / Sio-4) TaxID=880071 RepID=I4APM3_BERLS|nr:response regulator [Bernardetia litoralis]AFM05908.1 signal transduction histidine kinase [Bernardetia litoralis DSM 6794]
MPDKLTNLNLLSDNTEIQTKSKKTSSILYVDDEESNLRIFKSSFRRHYSIFTAISGKEGLEILENNNIQLVISDQKMPEMTGVEFLERVAENFPNTVRIILTAYSDTEDIMRAINKCGIFRYLVKPWNKDEMLLTIDKALETYSLRTENRQLVKALKSANEDLEGKVKERTSELMATNEDLKKAKEQAEAATKTKEQFLSTMSHEIRTPLNAIIGMTHLLKNDRLEGEMAENIEILEFSAQNLLSLINSVLDISKMEAGKMAFEQAEFDLPILIQNTVEIFKARAEEKNIFLRSNIDKNIPKSLLGDSTRLSQILNNLIGNAIKFTDEGTVTITVRLLHHKTEKVELLFAISDTGIGISSEKINSIFEDFSQAEEDTSRKYGGTGLGLAITKQLVELQGGTINVMSTMMVGSTFSFQLGFKIGKIQAITANLPDATNIKNLKGVRILIVEDNKVNQILVRKFLNNWGASSQIAENGQIALDLFKKDNFDVVLMDLQMPVMDGYESARQMRLLEENTDKFTPIIALTASTLLNERERIIQVGMNDFLSKPFNPNELYKKIAQHSYTQLQNQVLQESEIKGKLNYSYFKNLAGADKDFYTELLELSEADLIEFNRILESTHLLDYETQLSLVHHKIRATLRLLEVKELEVQINQLRRMLSQGSPINQVTDRIQAIQKNIEMAISEIQEERK